jgi:hypothetical protein
MGRYDNPLRRQAWTIARRLTDILAYFDNTGTGRRRLTNPTWEW